MKHSMMLAYPDDTEPKVVQFGKAEMKRLFRKEITYFGSADLSDVSIIINKHKAVVDGSYDGPVLFTAKDKGDLSPWQIESVKKFWRECKHELVGDRKIVFLGLLVEDNQNGENTCREVSIPFEKGQGQKQLESILGKNATAGHSDLFPGYRIFSSEDKRKLIFFNSAEDESGNAIFKSLTKEQIKSLSQEIVGGEWGQWSALVAYPGYPPQSVTVRSAEEIKNLVSQHFDSDVDVEFLSEPDLPEIVIAVDKEKVITGRGLTGLITKCPILFLGENQEKDGFIDLTDEQRNLIVSYCAKNAAVLKPAKVVSTRKTYYEKNIPAKLETEQLLAKTFTKASLFEIMTDKDLMYVPEGIKQFVYAKSWLEPHDFDFSAAKKAHRAKMIEMDKDQSSMLFMPALHWQALEVGYQLYNHRKAGCRVYDVDADLGGKLADTKLHGLRGADFRLPFSNIYIIAPKGIGLRVYNNESKWHELDGLFVTAAKNPENDKKIDYFAMAVGEDRPKDGDALYWFHVSLSDDDLVDDNVTDLVRASIGTEVGEADPSVGVMKDDWRKIFYWMLNVCMYVTHSNPGARILANPEARKLWSKIDAMPFGSRKRQGLEAKAKNVPKQERLVLRQSEIQIARNRREREEQQGTTPRRSLTVRVRVQGHWRNMRVGIGRTERRKKWIEPFWRGPDMAEIFAKRRIVKEVKRN